MALKSGASHAAASFLSIVLGSVLSGYLGVHADLLTDASEAAGAAVLAVLAEYAGVSLPRTVAGVLVIGAVISFAWGVAYHFARHGT